MSYDYSRSEPGCPGISLHCDGLPWWARIWIYEGGNKPADMAREAPGMNPSRWDRD